MKIYNILGFFLILFSQQLISQQTVQVNLYSTSIEYHQGVPAHENIEAKMFSSNENLHFYHFRFKKQRKNKKELKAKDHWAVEYNGELYVNLNSSLDLMSDQLYVKLNVVRDHVAYAIIDGKELNRKNGHLVYFDDLIINLDMDISHLIKNSWEDENGQRKHIVYVDFSRLQESAFQRDGILPANILNPNYLMKHYGQGRKTRRQLKSLKVKEVISIIEQGETD